MKSELSKYVNWVDVGERIAEIVEKDQHYQETSDAVYALIKELDLPLKQSDIIEDYVNRVRIATEEAAYSLGFADGGKMMAAMLAE